MCDVSFGLLGLTKQEIYRCLNEVHSRTKGGLDIQGRQCSGVQNYIDYLLLHISFGVKAKGHNKLTLMFSFGDRGLVVTKHQVHREFVQAHASRRAW